MAPRMKGLSYTSFGSNDFQKGLQNGALTEAQAQTGADFIALNVFVYQQQETSTTISSTFQTSSDEDIRLAIQDARSHSMKVFLKVNVDVVQGRWRGYIVPDNAGAWFSSYTALMLHYAMIAEQMNVEMFSIGCELVGATRSQYSSKWRELISTVRGRYSGKLIYCANWDGIQDLNGGVAEYQQVNFWDALDFVGVDMYPPLARSSNEIPSQALALQRVSGIASLVRQQCQRYGRNLVLSESGLASVRGALAAPWDSELIRNPNTLHDEESQALYYSTMIAAFGSQDWCEGIFWWNWEAVQSPISFQDFSPQNKRAALVVKNWYSLSS